MSLTTTPCDCCGKHVNHGILLYPDSEIVCQRCFEFLTRYAERLNETPSSRVLTLAFKEAELL